MASPACVSVDPELFYPPTYGPAHRSQVAAAKSLCLQCEVRPQCLRAAVSTAEEFGIWGGTTPHERRGLRGFRLRVGDAPVTRAQAVPLRFGA